MPRGAALSRARGRRTWPIKPLTGESIELPPVARELLAFRLDDLGRRPLDETVVGEHPLGAPDLLLQPLDLGGGVSVPGALVRANDRFEDPQLLAFEGDADTAAPEHLRRLLHALE